MYSTKPRALATSKQDIIFLPLDEIGKKFKALMSSSYQDWKDHKEYLLEKLQNDFLLKWNQTHEESYEGSFDELGFEEKVSAQAGAFSGLGSEQKDELKLFLEDRTARMGLVAKAEWFFPQALAEFARLPLVKNDKGLYSAKALLNNHIKPNDQLTGLFVLFKHCPRSLLVKGQTDPLYRNYSALVPLIMSAFKKHANIKYSEWARDEVHYITEQTLADVMQLTELPEMTAEEVLEARDSALTPKSGAKAGVARSPLTTYTLYVTKDYPDLVALPMLGRIMMCQTWCAHPSNRTEYMITNPLSWDTMPEPLVTSSVFRKPSPSEAVKARETPIDTSFDW